MLHRSPQAQPVPGHIVSEAYAWNTWATAVRAHAIGLESIPETHPRYAVFLAELRESNATMYRSDPVMYGFVTASWPSHHKDRFRGGQHHQRPWRDRAESVDASMGSALDDLLSNRF